MKTLLLLFPLLLGTSAFAQSAFYPGAPVRFDVVGSDDGLFAIVVQSNVKTVRIKMSRVGFNVSSQKPMVHEIQQILPVDLLRATNQNDFCFPTGSYARIVNPYLRNSNVIGKVLACDGRQVILEFQTDPSTTIQQIFQMDDLVTSSSTSFTLKKDDQVICDQIGFPWSGLTATVQFSNNQYAWIEYQDLRFETQHAKVLVQDLKLEGTSFHADFRIASLGLGFQNVASISVLARETFFTSLGVALDKFLPTASESMSRDSIRYQARLFAFLAARPVVVVTNGKSEVFQKEVIPAYEQAYLDYGVTDLGRLMITPEVIVSAGVVLEAALDVLNSQVTNQTDRTTISDQNVNVALLIASRGNYTSLTKFLNQSKVIQPLLTRLQANQNLSPYVVAYQSVFTYLEGNSNQ